MNQYTKRKRRGREFAYFNSLLTQKNPEPQINFTDNTNISVKRNNLILNLHSFVFL